MSNRIGKIIAEMSPQAVKAILRLREIHSCLMELDRDIILELQDKAVRLNYQAGEGRILDSVPHYYDRPTGNGGTVMVETYFKYINRVH